MTTPTQGEHAQTEALRPKFGDLLRNTMASESNPRRDAYFIREVHRSGGGVNPGRWFEMTDGKGETWLSNPQNMVPAATAQPAAPQGGAYAELPKITAEDRLFLHDNPNTDDIVKWVQDYARACIDAERTSHGQAPAGATAPMGERERQDMIDAFRTPLELIALGESTNPAKDATDALVSSGFWDAESVDRAARAAPQPANPWLRALEIRMAQGWKLKGDRIPVLYTDTINGDGVGRDDLWLCTTAALTAPQPATADALSIEEATLLQKAVTDFEECGETDVPDAALRRFAEAGYLECVHYHVMPAAQEAIDTALAAQREVKP